jgi:hypothetical protein
MSGVAGADRIERKDFAKVMEDYFNRIIKPKYPNASIKPSGSYVSNLSKMDFGDMDLILTLPGDDKKQVKLELQKYLESLPSDVIMSFRNPKYKGKRSYNAGELVSVMYPQGNGKTVQIDNMVSLSEVETEFKGNFLDLPAEKQGLVLGLVKVACIENSPKEIFNKLGLKFPTNIEENQEYEFNLSGQNLTLRLVTYEPGTFKEISREELWKSNQWSDVQKLLDQYDFSDSFEDLLQQVAANLKNPRSKNRIYGVFKSMITVKSGEVGTPKGEAKEKALQDIKTTLNLSETRKLIDFVISQIIKEYKLQNTR